MPTFLIRAFATQVPCQSLAELGGVLHRDFVGQSVTVQFDRPSGLRHVAFVDVNDSGLASSYSAPLPAELAPLAASERTFRVLVTDIAYDNDENAPELPHTLCFAFDEVMDAETLEQVVSDRISDETGFCHHGFQMQLLDCWAKTVFVDFASDHFKHFGAFPGDIALASHEGNEVVYGFDAYMSLANVEMERIAGHSASERELS